MNEQSQASSTRMGSRHAGIVVFSGGSAANSLVDGFNELVNRRNWLLTYAVAISDNGGSSSEINRFVGGPSVGDLRSRLVRLIPSQPVDPEKSALRNLFNHRLSSSPEEARLEWLDIVESRSPLWFHISTDKKEVIRSFLNHLNFEIVKRARPPNNIFNFQSASIGNMFLTGARLFCGSFEAGVYLLGNITGIPDGVQVLPVVNSNFSHHISAGLLDGKIIVGQNAISHPGIPSSTSSSSDTTNNNNNDDGDPDIFHEHGGEASEDANLPGSLPSLRQQNITFSKSVEEELPSRIERIWYINPYGQEIRVPANPKIMDALRGAECVIYSIGSLYTSIIPCLILRGIGEAICNNPSIRYKILILNGSLDRETGPGEGFTATDFVMAITKACLESRGVFGKTPPEKEEVGRYVTHVIHLDGEGTPKVDMKELKELGVECLRVYGRKVPEGEGEKGRGRKYDAKGLFQALEAILGNRNPRTERMRRMTFER